MASKKPAVKKTAAKPAAKPATSSLETQIDAALGKGKGVLRLAPTWVPRTFIYPGRRMKLAEEDLYVHGPTRGGISERWFASTVQAQNGPGTPEDEGLSYVVGTNGKQFLLREAVAARGQEMIGAKMFKKYGKWPNYAKFFDPMGAIAHHLHHREEHAKLVGQEHKPEAYYFPKELNANPNIFPYTFMGLEPGTTRQAIIDCLEQWRSGKVGDNGILDFSRAFRLKPGTGWQMPAGILHAPGSMLIFEVLWGSDVFAMFQSMIENRPVDWSWLTGSVPADKTQDLEFIVDLIDWEGSTNPRFKESHYLEPILTAGGGKAGFTDKWVIYGKMHGQDLFSAKELTVTPGSSVVLKDGAACGLICTQGHGKLGVHDIEAPNYIRYGETTNDEFFISDAAAQTGVKVTNTGSQSLTLIRYFGPGSSPKMPKPGDHRRA
jgi:hypothetical protein